MNNLSASSLKKKTVAFQATDGGVNPTLALHFAPTKAIFARTFIAQHHYSKSCPPSSYYFEICIGRRIVGAMAYRFPSLPKTARAYDVHLELARLVLLDEIPRNTESRFIGWSLRWLKKNTGYSRVISYADPRFGHTGIIYKASNFQYAGLEKGHGTRRLIIDGREWHPKSAFDHWGCSGAKLSKILPASKVEVFVCPPKHVYIYDLRVNNNLTRISA